MKDNSQSYPARTKFLRRPRNGLYLDRVPDGLFEMRQLSKKREVHFATDDENSKPEEKIKDTKCNGVMEIGSDEEQPASPGISQRLRKRKAQSAAPTIRVSIELSVGLVCMIWMFIALHRNLKDRKVTPAKRRDL